MKKKVIPCVVFINSMKGQKEIKRWAAKNQIESKALNPGFYRYNQYICRTESNRLISYASNNIEMGEFCGDNVELFKKLCIENVIWEK